MSQGLKLLGVVAIACAAWTAFAAAQDIKFALDWKFEGQSAPYFVAIDKGYYGMEGLNVAIDSGPGSVAGIARVAAGTHPLGFFDINSLIKFRDENPDKAVKAVMMVYNKPPFAIATTAVSNGRGWRARSSRSPTPTRSRRSPCRRTSSLANTFRRWRNESRGNRRGS